MYPIPLFKTSLLYRQLIEYLLSKFENKTLYVLIHAQKHRSIRNKNTQKTTKTEIMLAVGKQNNDVAKIQINLIINIDASFSHFELTRFLGASHTTAHTYFWSIDFMRQQ